MNYITPNSPEKLNIKLSEEDIAIFMASDIDNDGQLSFEEFCDFTQHRSVFSRFFTLSLCCFMLCYCFKNIY